jgi:hypothetical protein
MKNRNPILVLILSFITFGIYGLIWLVSTKEEMNQRGANVPTAWMLFIPVVNILWMWKYAGGVGQVTNKELSDVVAFLLLIALGPIGFFVIQSKFNDVK